MSNTLTTAATAGWYPDPGESDSLRWWDGATWTHHVHPAAQLQQPKTETLTPATPASEQLYWHSAGAEVVQIPGRQASTADPARRQGTSYAAGHPARFWGDAGSPHTAGIWLLAALPLFSVALQFALGLVFGVTQGAAGVLRDIPGVVYVVVIVIAAWTFAGLDIKALRFRGYEPPTIWWMLVPFAPLAYFIARGKVVRAEGKRAWPPELLFFLSVVGVVGVTLVAVMYIVAMLGETGGLIALGSFGI